MEHKTRCKRSLKVGYNVYKRYLFIYCTLKAMCIYIPKKHKKYMKQNEKKKLLTEIEI